MKSIKFEKNKPFFKKNNFKEKKRLIDLHARINKKCKASVVELVDTLDLGSSAARFESSSLSTRNRIFLITLKKIKIGN